MSKTLKSTLDDARETFARERLTLPPVPDRFNEVLTKKAPDYVAFSHAGHGINSYAPSYQLVDGPLAVFAQAGWGGGYSDKRKDTQLANDLFARCTELISAGERAKARGLTGPPGRLVVIESEMREKLAWGWLNRPSHGQAVREWLREHSVRTTADAPGVDRRDLPTIAALEWLHAASK